MSEAPAFRGTERYQVLERLGAGAQGSVWRAQDLETGRMVALKRLAKRKPGSLRHFKEEFRSLTRLAHPNIVTLLELHAEGDEWFFTMELVEGAPLDRATRTSELVTQSVAGPIATPASLETSFSPSGDASGHDAATEPLVERRATQRASPVPASSVDAATEPGKPPAPASDQAMANAEGQVLAEAASDPAAVEAEDLRNDRAHANVISASDAETKDESVVGIERVPGSASGTAADSSAGGERLPVRSDRMQARGSLAPRGNGLSPVLDFDLLRDRLRQLALAICWLHREGRLHRDLKPSNVLVESSSGRVVLVDFGLVLRVDARHERDALMGTPGFLAPEVCAGGDATTATDWYSFGALAYLLLTGRLPVDNRGLPAVWAKLLVDATPVAEVVTGIPDDLADLVDRLLRRDPQERPSTQDILRTLGEATLRAGEHDAVPDTGLVGRETELSALVESVANPPTTGPSVLLLHAASGFGKTRLLDELAGRLQSSGALVLVGRCFERDATPYKALDGLLDALAVEVQHGGAQLYGVSEALRVLGTLFPVLRDDLLGHEPAASVGQGDGSSSGRGTTDRGEPAVRSEDLDELALTERLGERPHTQSSASTSERRRQDAPRDAATRDGREGQRIAAPAGAPEPVTDATLASALEAVLAALSRDRAVVLAVDDAQWADEDSMRLLIRALGRSEAPPVRVLFSYRTEERATSPALGVALGAGGLLDRARASLDLRLDPLGNAQIRALAHQLSETLDAEVVEMLERESGGSPLLVRELAAHVMESGESLASLDGLVRARVASLEERTRQLVRLVTLASEPVSAAFLSHLELLEVSALNQAQRAHLIRTVALDRGLALAPFHDRVRTAIVSTIDPSDQLELHRSLAEAGIATRSGAGFVARNLRAAGEAQRAAEYYFAAGTQAESRRAYINAAEHFAAAAECGLTPREQALERRATALRDAGHGIQAAKAYVEFAGASPDPAARRAKIAALEQYLFAGAYDEASSLIRELLRAIGVDVKGGTGIALARFAFQSVRLALRGLEPRVRPGVAAAADLEELDLLWSATIGLSMADPLASQAIQKRHLRRALDVAEPRRLTKALAIELAFSGLPGGTDERRSQDLSARAHDIAQRCGDDYSAGFVTMSDGAVHWLRGRWTAAHDKVSRALQAYERCRGVTWESDTARFVALSCLIHRGDVAAVSELVDELVEDATSRGDAYLLTQVKTRGSTFVALTQGDAAKTMEIGAQAISAWTPSGYHIVHFWHYASRIAALLLSGRAQEALAAVDAEAKPLRGSLLLLGQYYRAQALELEARAALAVANASASDGKTAAAALRRAGNAVAKLEREKIPWCEASATLLRGCLQLAQGRSAEARETLGLAQARLTAVDQLLDADVALAVIERIDAVDEHACKGLEQMRARGVASPSRWLRFAAPLPGEGS